MRTERLPRLTILGANRAVLARLIERTCAALQQLQGGHDRAHLVLTGGGTGQGMCEAMWNHPATSEVDWSRVTVWWGDERFVPEDSDDRNDRDWMELLTEHLGVPHEHVFRTPSPITHHSVAAATSHWDQVLRREYLPTASRAVVILGVGPDGHIASLFPHAASLRSPNLAIGVTRSPKPPAERISFTLNALNRASVMLVATSGSEMSQCLAQGWEEIRAHALSPMDRLPVGLAHGTESTSWIVDREASALIRSQA